MIDFQLSINKIESSFGSSEGESILNSEQIWEIEHMLKLSKCTSVYTLFNTFQTKHVFFLCKITQNFSTDYFIEDD